MARTKRGVTSHARHKKIVDMADGREKTDLIQGMGLGLNQLRAMTDAASNWAHVG